MLRIVFLILVNSFLFSSCTSNKKETFNPEVLATINNQHFSFVKDTILFKKEVTGIIFSKESKVVYDKVRILEQHFTDKSKQRLYYVMLYDFEKNIKTARVLKQVKNTLIFTENTNFDKMYTSCVGTKTSCVPRIIITDSKKSWICSDSDEIKECSSKLEGCNIYRTVYLKSN